jgi:heat shock protein HtpX
LVVAIIVAALMNIISYFYSDRIALALYRTRRVTSGLLPQLYRTVERLAQRGLAHAEDLPGPNDSPNAFATGRNPSHASVAVSQGLLNPLSDEGLEGVLERELVLRRTRKASVQFSGALECR